MRFAPVVALVVVAACGGQGRPEAEPRRPDCADVFADGASVDRAVEVDLAGCADGDTTRVFGFVQLDCPDGRSLLWNDQGWGYTGGTWNRHTGGELVAPNAAMDDCILSNP